MWKYGTLSISFFLCSSPRSTMQTHCSPAHPNHTCLLNPSTPTTYQAPAQNPNPSKPKEADPNFATKHCSVGSKKEQPAALVFPESLIKIIYVYTTLTFQKYTIDTKMLNNIRLYFTFPFSGRQCRQTWHRMAMKSSPYPQHNLGILDKLPMYTSSQNMLCLSQ